VLCSRRRHQRAGEVGEAALVDGASHYRIFFNIMLPARVDRLKDWPDLLVPVIARVHQLTRLCPGTAASLADWAETMRKILLAIYGELSIEVGSPEHRHLARPLQAIQAALIQWMEVPAPLQGSFTASEAMDLLKRQLGRELIAADDPGPSGPWIGGGGCAHPRVEACPGWGGATGRPSRIRLSM
jgi:hypothetical protein